MVSRTEAFARFGAKLTNAQWSWSARIADAVVLSLCSDKFDWKAKPITYDGGIELEHQNKPGNKERIRNLRWARDHCQGRIKVVMLTNAAHPGGERKIKDCFPRPELTMRLTRLNEETGEFSAELVENV